MPMPMPMKKPMPKPAPMDQAEEQNEQGKTVLNMRDYPELQGAKEGQKISGSFEGTVESMNGDAVTISYDKIDMTTENSADRELGRMTGKSSVPVNGGEDDASEEY